MDWMLEAIVAVLRDLIAICDELPWVVLDYVLVSSGSESRSSGTHASRGMSLGDRRS